MRDTLLKGRVARYWQVFVASLSLKKEIHLSHGLLLQRFVGIGDEMFEEFLHSLIQPRQSIATGTPFWQKTQIAIAIFDLPFAKLLLPALNAPHRNVWRHMPEPVGSESRVTHCCYLKVLRLSPLQAILGSTLAFCLRRLSRASQDALIPQTLKFTAWERHELPFLCHK